MTSVAESITILVGGLICVVVAIIVIPSIGSAGFVSGQTAANLTSSSTELSYIIPGIALLLGIGVIGKVVGR